MYISFLFVVIFLKLPSELSLIFSKTNPITNAVCTRDGFTMPDDNTNEDINNAELYKNYYNLDDDGDSGMDSKNMKLMIIIELNFCRYFDHVIRRK